MFKNIDRKKNIDRSTFTPKLPIGRKIAAVAITQFLNPPKSLPTNIEQLRERGPGTTSRTKMTRDLHKQKRSKLRQQQDM